MTIETTSLTPEAQNASEQVFKNAVLLVLELRRPGMRRMVKTEVSRYADAGEAVKFVHISKDILQSKELEAIAAAHGEMRRYVQSKCLPSRFKYGTYLLPITLLSVVDDYITSKAQSIAELVEAFLTKYPERRSEAIAKLKLAGLDDESDYPSAEALREQFDVRTAYVAFDTPTALKTIRQDIFDREREKAAATWVSAVDEAKNILHGTLTELTGALAERLTPTEDGKPKVFRDSLVTNMLEFLDTFDAKNSIANFGELEGVVSAMRTVLTGVDGATLRKDVAVRTAVAENVSRIKDALATMVINKPTRAFTFSEEA